MEMNPEADLTRSLRRLADAWQGLPWPLRNSGAWPLAWAEIWRQPLPSFLEPLPSFLEGSNVLQYVPGFVA